MPHLLNLSRRTRSYKKLAQDVQPGSSILCADGSIVLEVISTDPAAGTVRARCKNTAMLGERKNVNLPGVVVDLPTLTDKDVDDIVNWGVANEIDLIAASFVRKGSDLDLIRDVLGERGRYIKIISKVRHACSLLSCLCLGRSGMSSRVWQFPAIPLTRARFWSTCKAPLRPATLLLAVVPICAGR